MPVIYQNDFSSNPNWTSSDDQNFFWDAQTGTYVARTIFSEPRFSSTGDQFGYTYVPLDVKEAFSISFDYTVIDSDGQGQVNFGLFPEDADIFSSFSVGRRTFTGSDGLASNHDVRAHTDAGGVVQLGVGSAGYTDEIGYGVWLEVQIEYDGAQTLEYTISNRETAEVYFSRDFTTSRFFNGTFSPSEFDSEMQFIGASLTGHTTSTAGYQVTAFDNIEVIGQFSESASVDREFADLSSVPLSDLIDLAQFGQAVTLEISDDNPGTDGGLFLSVPSTGPSFSVPRPTSGPYRLEITPAELEFWSYQPGNSGTNAIQVEAVDSAGNVSAPLIINLTFTDSTPTSASPVVSGQAVVELDTSLAGGTTSVIFDNSVLNVTDSDGDLSFIRFYDSTPGEDGGFLALDGVRITGAFVDVGPAGLDRVSYVAGPNEGSNDIVVEAFDSEGNDSNDFTVRLNVTGTTVEPNEAPSLNISEPFSQAFAIPENTTLIVGLNASDDSDSEGNGLTYSLSGSSADLLTVDQATGNISFVDAPDFEAPFDSFTQLMTDFAILNGYEFTVTVTDSSGLSDSADFFVRVTDVDDDPEPLERATSLELEYFARQSAYGYSELLGEKGDKVEATIGASELELFLDGWEVKEEFGGGDSTFRAIVLDKAGTVPVLAVRGTLGLDDWAENFRESVPGFDEVAASLVDTGLDAWMRDNTFSIAGHSQGGAQAQLIAIYATGVTNSNIDQLFTFNAPGAGLPSAGSLPNFTNVQHFVNASDVVSLVGKTHVDGTLNYYDFTVDGGLLDKFLSAHTSHWSQEDLWQRDKDGLGVLFEGSDGPSKPQPIQLSLGEFSDPTFDPFQDTGQDSEFAEIYYALIAFLGVHDFIENGGTNFFADKIDFSSILTGVDSFALRNDLISKGQTREGWEEIRADWGPVIAPRLEVIAAGLDGLGTTKDAFIELGRDTVQFWFETGQFTFDMTIGLGNLVLDGTALAGKTVTGLGNFLIDSAQGAVVQTFVSTGEAVSWINERFQDNAIQVPIVSGNHAGSTPAIIGDFSEGLSETLSSSSSGSLFILTDPGTTVEIESGNNIFWGGAENQADTYIRGGVSETDAHFIQDAFFETDDLDLERGSAVIRVDLDQDGENDITITWEGDYRLDSIIAEQGVDGTYIRYLGNALPEATDDEFASSESISFTTGNVLLNDTDEDGDVLSVAGLDLTGTIGSVVDNGDGTFDYDPNGAFDDLLDGETASDIFAYFVSDGVETVRGEVTVTVFGQDAVVGNQDPVPSGDAVAARFGTAVTFDPIDWLSNDTDPDGDAVSLAGIDFAGVTGGVVSDNGDGTYTFTPNFEFTGGAGTATYTVDDGRGGSAQSSVVFTVGVPGDRAIEATILSADEGDSGINRFEFGLTRVALDGEAGTLQTTDVIRGFTGAVEPVANPGGLGEATPTDDYIPADTSVTFGAGETFKTITVEVVCRRGRGRERDLPSLPYLVRNPQQYRFARRC